MPMISSLNSALIDISEHLPFSPLDSCHSVLPHRPNQEMRIDRGNTVAGAEIDNSGAERSTVDHHHLEDELVTILNSNRIGFNTENRYVPEEKLDGLLTKDAVQIALGITSANTLTDFITQKAKKTFALLLITFHDRVSQVKAITRFQSTGFTDETLHTTTLKLPTTLSLCKPRHCDREGGTCAHHFPYEEPWTLATLNHFEEGRWQFLLHSFNHKQFVYEIDSRHHLPFTGRVPSGELTNGNFSEVICVQMLANKQTTIFSSEQYIYAALKTLRRINGPHYDIHQEWRREARAHSALNNPHIIQGIAAIRQVASDPLNDEYHLLLEWADGGSLYDFLQSNPKSPITSDLKQSRKCIMEVLEQMRGLASALEYMHMTPDTSPESSEHDSVRASQSPHPERNELRGATGPTMPIPRIDLQVQDDSQQAEGEAVDRSFSVVDLNGPPGLVRHHTHFDSENWRHGDIKPENILRFTGNNKNPWIGTLKIADLGRARQHTVKTQLRETIEKEAWRTRWYEPPDLVDELHLLANGQISRLFDIWSMGCVSFEIALWLLFGFDSINGFLIANDLPQNDQHATPYWKKSNGKYSVTETASRWMDYILEHDPEREGAIGDLVKLVKDKLLKVTLPPNSDKYTTDCRTNAHDMTIELDKIIARAGKDDVYLCSGADRSSIKPPLSKSSADPAIQALSTSVLSRNNTKIQGFLTAQGPGPATAIAQQRVYTNNIQDIWNISDEDEFMQMTLKSRRVETNDFELCAACKEIDISSPKVIFAKDSLQDNKEDCELCEMVYDVTKASNDETTTKVQLRREDDSLVFGGTEKVLRLCRTNSLSSDYDQINIPVGAPVLFKPSEEPSTGDDFMKLLKAWLKECDNKHNCRRTSEGHNRTLPKTLIHIIKPDRVKLVDPEALKLDPSTHYIALSHKWGQMPNGVETSEQNMTQRRKRITLTDLTLNFRNAISITKALGCDYLWIDSLCIKQGRNGDFCDQADKMQSTFSNAYCVIAACNNENPGEGFLHRRETKYVKLGNVFVSSTTNDFEKDVLHSPLHRRGWVLQEHALAQRTIYFTENQIYLECGDGIRCETMTKLRNDEAAFLGDPNFPNYTIRTNSTRGEQMHLFTKLFEQYSRLEFSRHEDRPVAIDGLMDRLTTAFKTESLAGLFKTFWGRCLLWQRAEGTEPLVKIPFGSYAKRAPPSWSWMAFEGAISFIKPDGGTVDWNEVGVKLPFANRIQSSWLKTSSLPDSIAIRADVYGFTIAKRSQDEVVLSYDDDRWLPIKDMLCMIVGKEKQEKMDLATRKHYVVLIDKVAQVNGSMAYERVGVGYMSGRCIHFANRQVVLIE